MWIEGFESIGVSIGRVPSPIGVLNRKYPTATTGIKVQAGRFGGYAAQLIYSTILQTPGLNPTGNILVVGFAWKTSQLATSAVLLPAALYDDATLGINLRPTVTGELAIYLGSTLLKTTSGLGLTINNWYWIELKVLCAASVGTYEVRVGGLNVLSDTGVTTKAGTHNYHNSVMFYNYYSGPVMDFDDIYILDGSGSVNNDFLGNMKVVAIVPNADVSGAKEFTPSSAVDHYTLVDENPITDDTDYVEDGTTGHRDLWEYGSVSSLGAIAGLQINTMVRETDATSFDLKMPVQSNGVDSDGTGQTVGSANYKTLRRIVETDPDTGVVWTMDGINAARFGVKVG